MLCGSKCDGTWKNGTPFHQWRFFNTFSHTIHGTGVFTYIWLTFIVGTYAIHGFYGFWYPKWRSLMIPQTRSRLEEPGKEKHKKNTLINDHIAGWKIPPNFDGIYWEEWGCSMAMLVYTRGKFLDLPTQAASQKWGGCKQKIVSSWWRSHPGVEGFHPTCKPTKSIKQIWVFPKIMIPQNRWFIWKSLLKRMIWGYTYFRKHPHKPWRVLTSVKFPGLRPWWFFWKVTKELRQNGGFRYFPKIIRCVHVFHSRELKKLGRALAAFKTSTFFSHRSFEKYLHPGLPGKILAKWWKNIPSGKLT